MLKWLRRLHLPVPRNLIIPPRLIFASHSIAVIIAVVIIQVVDKSDTAPLAWALIALITVSSLVRSLPAPEGLTTLFSIAIYGGIQVMRTVQGMNSFTEGFAGAFAFVLAAWFSRALSLRLSTIEEDGQRSTLLVEELTARDKVTGAIKRRHFQKLVLEEIQRSRRYNHCLSLLVIGIDEWESAMKEKGVQEANRMLMQLVEVLSGLLRNVDTVARHNESQLAVILPETALEGARCVAKKMCEEAAEKLGMTVRAGIAEFPADAVSVEELVAEAEAALLFSKTAALRITDRSLIN